ncbi:MAG: serine hydrolase [Bacteriovoracaceae bacterium]|nr:serine hydrolase [Bacteriovoracaceae bacterium]
MNKINHIISSLLPHGPMDAIGVGVIDFKKKSYEAVEANNFEMAVKFKTEPTLYFDLASLTKPLTNSLSYFLKPDAFDQGMLLCLNHRGGLPSWGLLPEEGWQEQILSYPIKESETLYSDFSALRVMLELARKGVDEKKICQEVWDKETLYWTDLPSWFPTLQLGHKNGLPNYGEVHDPNAWTIGHFCSHAGLFSTTDGLCRTLLNYQARTDFISQVKTDLKKHSHRFAYGWDRVVDPQNTLAGKGCGHHTFGHLGFTGTSIWIDPDKMIGHVILTNSAKFHWHDKANLNDLRRTLGEIIWSLY